MADKPTKIEGIQQVIAELRQLNKSSKKDMIREREALDRAEKLAAGQEEVVASGESAIDASTDFQRRFIAGQAKTLLEKGKLGQADKDDKPATRGRQDELLKFFSAQAADRAEDAREKDTNIGGKKAGGGGGNLAKVARGAAGMAAIGLGLGGFMSGLMAWSGVDAFKGDGFPTQAKNLTEGFNEIAKMDNKALTIMGSMVAAGGLFGATLGVGKSIKGAVGMSAVGLGLGGFMSGLMVWSEVDKFTGDKFPKQAENLTKGFNHLGGMSKGSIIALTSLAGLGALGGAVSIGRTTMAAGGMALAGLGLGGFMAGIAAPGDITGFKGDHFADQAKNLTTGFNNLGGMSTGAKVALTTLAALGAIGGAVSIGSTAFASGGMALAGLGLGGFMAGMSAAGDITKFKGDHFAAQAKNIADGLGAFTGGTLAGLAALMVTGAVLGPTGSTIAATGMGMMGIGIGAFVGGIAGIGDVLGAMGVNGSGLKTMLTNIAGGLSSFNDIDGKNFSSLGTGMSALGGGLLGLLGAKGLSGLGNVFSTVWNDAKDLFGFDSDQSTGLEKLISSVVKPFENIDFTKWNGIDATGFGNNLVHISKGLMAWSAATPGFWESMGSWAKGIFGENDPFEDFLVIGAKHKELTNAATAMEKLAKALKMMNAVKFDGDEFKFSKFAHDLVLGTKGIHVAMYGGTYDPPGFAKDQRSLAINRGEGLAGIPPLHFESAGKGITILQQALNNWDGNTQKSGGGGSTVINNGGNVTNTTLLTTPENVNMGVYNSVGPMSALARSRL